MGGIIGTFVVARGVLDGLRSIIETSIEFNRTIERAELGIGTILTAVGQVRGAFGETVSQAEQLSLAQAEARRQTQLLRRDALTTAATFEELLDVFQVALAPGLTAGLDVDEVRRFALRISQAALALGVAQNQLSEEVRSILSGTIRPQTTRIAVALGITNEDIARVRELGQLGEFLEERFAAFGVAGERALTTVDGLLGRVRDGFGQVIGEAGESVGFFDDVKDVLSDVLELFIDFDEFGFPQPDSQTLAVLRIFFETIQDGLQALRDELQGVTFEDAVQGARALASAITTGVNLLIGIVQGLVDGFAALGSSIRFVADLLGFDSQSTSVRQLARALTSVLTVLVSIRAVFGTLTGIIQPIVATVSLLGPLFSRLAVGALAQVRAVSLAILLNFQALRLSAAGLPAVFQAVLASIRTIGALVFRFAAAFGAVTLAVNGLVRAFTGIQLSFGETIEVILVSFQELFTRIRFSGQLAFELFANTVIGIFDRLASTVVSSLAGAFTAVTGGLGAVAANLGIITEETRKKLEGLLSAADKVSEGQGLIDFRFDTAGTINEQEAALGRIQQRFNDIAAAALARRQAEEEGTDQLEAQRAEARALRDSLSSVVDESESLLQTLDRVSAQFSNVRTTVQQVQEASERLRLAIQELDFQDQFAIDPDVTGVANSIQTAVQREQVTAARELENIRRQELDLLRQVNAAERARVASQQALAAFGAEEQEIIRGIDNSLLRIVQLRNQEQELVTQAALARAEERSSIEAGNQGEARAARDRRSGLEAELAALRARRGALSDSINLVQQEGVLSADALQFVQARLEVLSREASLQQDLATIQAEIARLRGQSLELQRRQAEVAAQRGLTSARAEAAQLSIQAELLADINRLETQTTASGAGVRLAQLQAQSRELQLQAQQQRLQLLLQVQSLDQTISRTEATRQTNPALFGQRDALAAQIGLLDQINEAEAERLAREIERARILSEGTAGEAIRLGVEDFVEQIGTLQEQLSGLTTQVIQTFSQGLASALSTALAESLDRDVEDRSAAFEEAFKRAAGNVLQQLSAQLLQTVIDSLLSSLLSSVLTATTTQTSAAQAAATITTSAAQIAANTRVTSATTAANIEVAAAQTAAAIRAAGSAAGGASTGGLIPEHFAGGGHVAGNLPRVTPPAGVPRSDTVPAYLTPGEFVQKVSAVRRYGVDVMRALNRGLIDPTALRSLMGVRKMANMVTTTQRGPGFQDGGLATENIRQVASNLEAQAGNVVAADTPPAVAMPVGEQEFEQQLAAGKDAFRRFLRANAHDFDGILRGGRTGAG